MPILVCQSPIKAKSSETYTITHKWVHPLQIMGMTIKWIQWWGPRSRAVWSAPSLPLLLDSSWLRVVVPVRIPSIGQADLFKNY